MTRSLALLIALAAGAAQAPPAPIQNGRVETRQTSSIDRELASASAASADPAWVGWRVPIVDGQRGGCCTYNDDAVSPSGVRGCFVENNGMGPNGQTPQIAAASGPLPLEAGTGLVILGRVIDGHLERLRTLGDDCPLDAGGRTVYWLQGVTVAESLRFLNTLVPQGGAVAQGSTQRLSDSAVSAIALHRDAGADLILDRLATASVESSTRRTARSLLGSTRGAHGFATIQQLLGAEHLPEIRKQLVNALGQTRQPGTTDALLAIARRDADARVRAEAAYWLPQRGGSRVLPEVRTIIDGDANDSVRQRAVQGLARLPGDTTTTQLIELARSSANAAVRKEAVTALGRSKDAKAVEFLEGLLK